jgi:hypothetical protein
MTRNFVSRWSMGRGIALATVVAIALAMGCRRAARNPEAEAAAVAAAEAWLKLVDNGRYAESWDASASFFRALVPKEEWVVKIGAIREAFGTCGSRQMKGTRFSTSVPSAPDGRYVLIQYKTVFENKPGAMEALTAVLDKDGTWRVWVYFIK